MKDVWVRNKERKFGFTSKVLLGTMTLVVVIGLGSTVHNAAPMVPDSVDDNAHESSLSETNLLDPFTLSTVVPAMESSPGGDILVLGGVKMETPIWIPYRLSLRSPILMYPVVILAFLFVVVLSVIITRSILDRLRKLSQVMSERIV